MALRVGLLVCSIATVPVVSCGGSGPEAERASRDTAPSASASGEAGAPYEPLREPDLDILLITIDTLRADALGSYGNKRAETPWMDRLASAGVRFENAHAHNVVTLPSHATILSGLHPLEHGVRDNSGFRFPPELPTLATILRDRGYRTGAFVSAFPLASRFGLARGFDVYEDSFVDAGIKPTFLEQERSGAETVALARSWIEQAAGVPSFTWVHLYEPHFPYAPLPPLAGRFRDDPYLGDVAAADAALAPLLEPILEAAAEGDTLVVLTSDHGESLGEHGEATHGIFGYEGVLKVPLVLYQPRLLKPRVVGGGSRLVDILPTILDLLAVPAPATVTGRSLVPLAAGAAGVEAPVTYFEALSGQLNRGWAPLFGVIRNGWKYIDLPIPELYDLAADPLEEVNLASSELRRVGELREVLRGLQSFDVGAVPVPESSETRERLRGLGYLGGGEAPDRRSYTEGDDPKRLIALDGLLREVTRLHAAGDLAAAASRCRELVRRRPGMRVAIMVLAQIERDLGNLDVAVEAMGRAFALNPEDTATLALLASYLTQAGRAREAAELTEVHARSSSPDLEVLFVRSLALARLERSEEAFATLRRAREREPRNPTVPVFRGTLELMAGRRNLARASYREALALNPNTVQAVTALAVMASEEGAVEEALTYWRRAAELDSREHAKLLAIGGRLWSAGRKTQARPLLELFADSAPSESFGEEIKRVRRLLD